MLFSIQCISLKCELKNDLINCSRVLLSYAHKKLQQKCINDCLPTNLTIKNVNRIKKKHQDNAGLSVTNLLIPSFDGSMNQHLIIFSE